MSRQTGRPGLGWYLEQIKDTPLLTAEEERALARQVREQSDPLARERMIQANLRLVVKIAKEYSNPGMTLGDLVAEGNLGLMRAVEEFDPDAGVRFSTYAGWWIKQAIKRAMINAGQPIHIPAYLVKLISKWRRTSSAYEVTHGRPPSIEEMSASLQVTPTRASIIQQGLQAVSAPTQVGGDDAQTISEVLVDDADASPEKHLMDESVPPIVEGLLERLDERQRKILTLRFGLDGYEGPQRTYKEIGQQIGLTRERVRQLEKQALQVLKECCEACL